MSTKEKSFDVRVPFAAWIGIHLVNEVCAQLRKFDAFGGLPNLNNPRRIKGRILGKGGGFDDMVIAKYWMTGSHYVTAHLGGHHNDHFGTQWKLVALRLQWRELTPGPAIYQDIRIGDVGLADVLAYNTWVIANLAADLKKDAGLTRITL